MVVVVWQFHTRRGEKKNKKPSTQSLVVRAANLQLCLSLSVCLSSPDNWKHTISHVIRTAYPERIPFTGACACYNLWNDAHLYQPNPYNPPIISHINSPRKRRLIASDSLCAMAVCQMSEAESARQSRCHVYWTICPYFCPIWYSFQLNSMQQKCPRAHSSVSYIFHAGPGNVNRGIHLEVHTHTEWWRDWI